MANTFDEYETESQKLLQGLQFLDFDTVQNKSNKGISDFYRPNDVQENISRKTPLAYSSLSKNGLDVRDNFFRGSKIYKYNNNLEIIVDPSSGIDPEDKIKPLSQGFYYDINRNKIKDENEEYLVTIKLFISKEKSQLDDVYNDPTIIPNPKEILFFLEDNTGDLSGTTLYIKKGSQVEETLTNLLSETEVFTDYIKSKYNISLSDLQELIKTGEVKSRIKDFLFSMIEFSSFFVTDPVLLGLIAKGIKSTITFIKENATINETNWNPKKVAKDKTFEPFLFPGVSKALDNLDDVAINEYINSGIKKLKTVITNYDKQIETALRLVSNVKMPILFPILIPISTNPVPSSFSESLVEKYKDLRNTMDTMLIDFEKQDFSELVKGGINVINAFLCGIWNGFVEAVCGIISLIQYLFEGAELFADLLKNFKEKGPALLEKIDDIILKFQNLDFGKIFSKLATSIKDWALSDSTTSLVEVAYFSGMFVGIVVELAIEIVVGILFTGGIVTVEAVLVKIGETFKALASLIIGIIKIPVKVAGKTLLALTDALKWLYEFLAKGTDEFLRVIDEMFAKLKKVAEEIFLQGRNLQKGGGDLNKSFFENAGVKIERFISEAKVIGQTSDNTCVATSLRMVLEDKRILRTEEELARVLKTDSSGASILDIPEALSLKRLDEVITVIEKKINIQQLEKTLKQGDKAIVSVGTKEFGNHAMVLEKIEKGKVFLRDPLPINKGASYKISLEEFELIFNDKAVIIKK